MASSIRLLSCQRLVRKNCSQCRYLLPQNSAFNHFLGVNSQHRFHSSAGCERCRQTGVEGRIGVFEFLPFTEDFRDELFRAFSNGPSSSSRPLTQLRRKLNTMGVETIATNIRENLLRGTISPQNALLALGIPQHMLFKDA